MTSYQQQFWTAISSTSSLDSARNLLENHRNSIQLNNIHPTEGLTPLGLAIVRQNIVLVDFLLSQPEIDPNQHCQNSWTPMLLAIENDSLPILEKLLSHPRIQVDSALSDGTTPFFLSCQMGLGSCVTRLLNDPRVDVNQPIDNGTTPYHIAAEFDKLEVVEMLMRDPRVDINQPRTNGATPFFMVCQKGLISIMEVMMKDPRLDVNQGKVNGATPFIIACQKGLTAVVLKLLTDPRVDCNRVLPDGHSALAIILGFDQIEVLKLLIASGKDLDTAQAIEVGKTELLDVLPEWLDFLKSIEKPFVTPLDIGEGKGHHECVRLLHGLAETPRALRHQLWKGFSLQESNAGELFAMTIFFVDNYLRFREVQEDTPFALDTKRFFKISEKLPIELQMILCHRVYGHGGDIFPKKTSDRAFTMLTWKLLVG